MSNSLNVLLNTHDHQTSTLFKIIDYFQPSGRMWRMLEQSPAELRQNLDLNPRPIKFDFDFCVFIRSDGQAFKTDNEEEARQSDYFSRTYFYHSLGVLIFNVYPLEGEMQIEMVFFHVIEFMSAKHNYFYRNCCRQAVKDIARILNSDMAIYYYNDSYSHPSSIFENDYIPDDYLSDLYLNPQNYSPERKKQAYTKSFQSFLTQAKEIGEPYKWDVDYFALEDGHYDWLNKAYFVDYFE